MVNESEATQDAYVAHLRSFRPASTVLELNEGSKGHAAMHAKRSFHQRTIKEVKAAKRAAIKRRQEEIDDEEQPQSTAAEMVYGDGTTADWEDEEEKPSKYRDANFFIDYLASGDDPKGEEGYALGTGSPEAAATYSCPCWTSDDPVTQRLLRDHTRTRMASPP